MNKNILNRKVLVKISGDYCAWHEVNLSVLYIFGDVKDINYDYRTSILYDDYIAEFLAKKLNIESEEIEEKDLMKISKEELDRLIEEFVKNFEYDSYNDYKISDAIIELEDKKIKNVFVKTRLSF